MDMVSVEESHPDYGNVNIEGLELILDYSEDRTSDKMDDIQALIHIETIGNIKCWNNHLSSLCMISFSSFADER